MTEGKELKFDKRLELDLDRDLHAVDVVPLSGSHIEPGTIAVDDVVHFVSLDGYTDQKPTCVFATVVAIYEAHPDQLDLKLHTSGDTSTVRRELQYSITPRPDTWHQLSEHSDLTSFPPDEATNPDPEVRVRERGAQKLLGRLVVPPKPTVDPFVSTPSVSTPSVSTPTVSTPPPAKK